MGFTVDLKQRVLSESFLQNNYPKTTYDEVIIKKTQSKMQAHVERYALHYLIANNASDASICNFIQEKINERNIFALRVNDTGYFKLTPLALATLMGRIEVVRALVLGCKDCIKDTVKNGWTPLHLARITSDSIYQLLLSNGASRDIKNGMEATPEDIGELISRDVKSISAEKLTWETDEGNVIPFVNLIKEGSLEKETGLKGYRDINYVPPYADSMRKLFEEDLIVNPNSNFYRYLTQGLQYFFSGKKTPKFGISIEDECRQPNKVKVRGLRVGETLKSGAIIGTYAAGFCVPEEMHKGSPYKAKDFDALQYGNHTRWMDWGFPNVSWADIKYKGITTTVVYVSDEEGIAENEFVYLHYGTGYYQTPIYKPFYILGQKRLEKFYKDGLAARLKEFDELSDENPLKRENFKDKLEYPVCAPCVMLHLHYKGIVHVKEWLSALRKGLNQHEVFDNWNAKAEKKEIRNLVISTLEDIVKIEDVLKENHKDILNYLNKWVLENIGVRSFNEIKGSLTQLLKSIQEPITLEGCKAVLNSSFEQLEKKL